VHRDYLGDFDGGSSFSLQSFPINPAQKLTFPWLSKMASLFETYHFHKLAFVFESEQPTAQSGQVMLAIDYDATDAAPASKYEMLNFKGARAVSVWSPLSIEMDPRSLGSSGGERYTRNGALPSNSDIKTYDVGNLLLAFNGLSESVTVGSLFVEYDVELITPQFDLESALFAESLKLTSSAGGVTTPFNTLTQKGGLPVTVTPQGLLTFSEVGQYMMALQLTGTTVIEPTWTGGSITPFQLNTNTNSAATKYTAVYNVVVPQGGGTVDLDTSGSADLSAVQLRMGPFLNLFPE
jgi:hypothetical protein